MTPSTAGAQSPGKQLVHAVRVIQSAAAAAGGPGEVWSGENRDIPQQEVQYRTFCRNYFQLVFRELEMSEQAEDFACQH